MAEKRCANGHVIDAAWDLCPYCPPDPFTGEISVVKPRGASESRPHRVTGGHRAAAPAAADEASRPRTAPQFDAVPPVSRTIAVPKADVGLEQASARLVVGWLVGLTGPVRGESFPVRIGKTTIGRNPGSDVVVPDNQTSGHHADLVYRPEEKRFILMDHNSTNGTYVNDEEIEPRRNLAHHDRVRIGSQTFLFVQLEYSWDEAVPPS
ncbi:MAG: FHA domain-containing protein [Thermoanaerobaculia bacterium]